MAKREGHAKPESIVLLSKRLAMFKLAYNWPCDVLGLIMVCFQLATQKYNITVGMMSVLTDTKFTKVTISLKSISVKIKFNDSVTELN